MSSNKALTLAIVFLILAGLACNAEAPSTSTPQITPTAPLTSPAATSPGVAPEVTATGVPGPGGCTLNAAFLIDITIPDNTRIAPNGQFIKTWRVRNNGTCEWTSDFQLVFASGEQMSGPGAVPLLPVAAGGTSDVSVTLVAPAAPGVHQGVWRLRSKEGTIFGSALTVVIIVPEGGGGSPAPATTAPIKAGTVVVPTKTNTPAPIIITATITPTAKAAFKTQQVLNQVTVAGNAIGHAVAACPSNSILVGGGFAGNGDLFVYNSSQSGSSWQVYAKNTSGANQLLNAYAVCLAGTGGFSKQELKQVTVSAGATGNAVAPCPAGSVVTGGGFAGSADGSLIVYNSSKSGNGWQIFAQNKAGANQTLNAYAICLSSTSATVDQVVNQASAGSGAIAHATATCPAGAIVTGGGFAGSANLFVYNTSMSNAGNGWESYANNLTSSSQLLNSYAICAKFP